MNFKTNKEHAIPLFIHSNILPLNMLYIKTICNLMYDVSNSSCPSSISDCFIQSKEVHTYNTRHCVSNNFYVEYSKLTTTITSFVKSGVKIWNSIPTDVRELGRKNFNLKIQKSLLTIFEIEDDYADVPTLIRYMSKHGK